MKRPKDMTTVELEALPEVIGAPWYSLADNLHEDDIAFWTDRTGTRFRFHQEQDGKWVKVRVATTRDRH